MKLYFVNIADKVRPVHNLIETFSGYKHLSSNIPIGRLIYIWCSFVYNYLTEV